jgi:hypothetical protein
MRSLATYIALGALLGCSSSSKSAAPSEDATPKPDGSDAKDVPAAVSGTRLRAKWYTAGDVRQFAGWHDNQRNEDCSFAQGTDSVLHCMPEAAQIIQQNAFADANCTKAAVGTSGKCDVNYVYTESYKGGGNGCGVDQVLSRQIQHATKVDPKSLYTNVQGSCGPFTPTAGTTYYALGDVVDPGQFVDATTSTDSGDGLVAKYVNASDGAREHVGWAIGSLNNADCTFQMMKDGSTRCVPRSLENAGTELYSDAACTASDVVQLGYYGPTCDPTSIWKAWVRRDTTAGICEPPSDIVAIGATYDGTGSLYQKYFNTPTSTSCTPRPSGSFANLYTLGASLTAKIPPTARVSSAGGRLVPALVSAVAQEGATRDLVRGWHDNDKDVDCTFMAATDGKVRCLPVSAVGNVFYTDATCQGPNRAVGFSSPTCGADSRYALETSATCPTVTRVWSLSQAQDFPNASASTNGHCVQIGLKSVYPATEADPAQFVEATLASD